VLFVYQFSPETRKSSASSSKFNWTKSEQILEYQQNVFYFIDLISQFPDSQEFGIFNGFAAEHSHVLIEFPLECVESNVGRPKSNSYMVTTQRSLSFKCSH
jgi:hypothetical protein